MGKRGPQLGYSYGAAAVASVFKHAHFPLSKQDVISKYGDKKIEYTKGNPVRVKDVLGDLPNDIYNSPADLEHAFHENL